MSALRLPLYSPPLLPSLLTRLPFFIPTSRLLADMSSNMSWVLQSQSFFGFKGCFSSAPSPSAWGAFPDLGFWLLLVLWNQNWTWSEANCWVDLRYWVKSTFTLEIASVFHAIDFTRCRKHWFEFLLRPRRDYLAALLLICLLHVHQRTGSP